MSECSLASRLENSMKEVVLTQFDIWVVTQALGSLASELGPPGSRWTRQASRAELRRQHPILHSVTTM